MYLMHADETNLEELDHVPFFIYGGLIVHADAAETLSDRVEGLRREHGFEPADPLKFQAGSRPPHVDRAGWNAAKGEVVDACAEVGARFIAVLVHHRIAANNRDVLIEWQLNTLLDAYNRFLGAEQDVGLVTIDRLPAAAEYALMAERFRIGSATPWGRRKEYHRILAYSSACDGCSHLGSAADVALGTFAYCVNDRREGSTRPRELMAKLKPLVWTHPRLTVFDRGVILNPTSSYAYGIDYKALKAHLQSLGL